MDDLIVGVGSSNETDSLTAGREAARAAMSFFKDRQPQVAVVLASTYINYNAMLKGIASVIGEIPMVGGTTAGEISTSGLGSDTIVLCLMASESMSFHTAAVRGMSGNELDCGRKLAKEILKNSRMDMAKSLILFPDGMGGDGVLLLKGVQSFFTEGFEIVGGFLGDDGKFEETYQFYNGRCYRGDLVSGLLICGNDRFVTSTGVASGFESIGGKIDCTKAEKNVIYELENQKALDFFKNLLGEERSKRLPEICLEYPFGLIDSKAFIGGYEYFQLRSGLKFNDDGSMVLAGSIPKGSTITLTTASRQDIINGARQAALQAKKGLKSAVPRLILMFSCIGRRLVLGRRTDEEIETVRQVFGERVPILGFYTYGEIGPIDKGRPELSAARFHNETVVLWALGEIQADPGTGRLES